MYYLVTCAPRLNIIKQSHSSIITVDQSQVLASSVLAAVSGFYHAPYAAVGHVYGLKSAPCVNAANVPVPCAAGYYGKVDNNIQAQGLFYQCYSVSA